MKNTRDDPLTKLADAAFRQAAQKVIKRAKESGTPVIIWEDGEVKRVKPRNTRKTRKKKIRKLKRAKEPLTKTIHGKVHGRYRVSNRSGTGPVGRQSSIDG